MHINILKHAILVEAAFTTKKSHGSKIKEKSIKWNILQEYCFFLYKQLLHISGDSVWGRELPVVKGWLEVELPNKRKRPFVWADIVLATFLLLWWDTVIEACYRRESLFGDFSFRGWAMTVMVQIMALGREAWGWSSSWELTSGPQAQSREN